MKNRATLIGAAVLAVMLLIAALFASITLAGGPTADFGDAPDATNSHDAIMNAYPGVVARFPTALQRSASPYGPEHQNAPAFFILGNAYSAEEAADSGADDDIDGINNIQPAVNVAGTDGFDDGLELPETFEHCQPVTLAYEVTVLSTYAGPMFANLWADWNHNGIWGGGPPATCPGATTAPEWVLQNEPLGLTTPGTYVFTVVLTPWYPDQAAPTWLRLTVSEQTAGDDGAGPLDGYLYGETEDYLVPGAPYEAFLPVVQGIDGTIPPPPDPDTHEDPEEPTPVTTAWLQLSPTGGTASVPADGLKLTLSNIGASGEAQIALTYMVNGAKSYESMGPIPMLPGPYMTDVIIYPPPSIDVRSPGTILAEVHVTPDGGSQGGDPAPNGPFDTAAEQIFFHQNTGQPGEIVIYTDEGYHAQIQAQAFDHNADLWSRLSLGFPGPVHPGLAQIVSYVHGDPVLMEGEPDEGHNGEALQGDGIEQPEAGGSQPESGGSFTLCLEWYTAPSDNGFGEDKGLNDDGWRARGALVRVYYSGSEVYDGYLNSAGCALIPMNAGNGGLAHIEFDGRSLLDAGNGHNVLRRVWGWIPPNDPVAWTAATQINGVQSGSVYRPEIPGNDAYSILSYGGQERFNGGENGNTLYFVKAGCGMDPAKGSCSTVYDGRHTIFISNGQWKKKFVVIHEWGHKILSWAASYTNDCSIGGGGHSISSTEYASCAAMEGWGHYVAVDVWNNHGTGNPGGKFVYWNGDVYDAEVQYKGCYATWSNDWICDGYGLEKDWMRFWWDFHTNPGTAPHHAQMFGIVDDVTWQNGIFDASDAFLDVLSGALESRWDSFACWNGIGYDHCQ